MVPRTDGLRWSWYVTVLTSVKVKEYVSFVASPWSASNPGTSVCTGWGVEAGQWGSVSRLTNVTVSPTVILRVVGEKPSLVMETSWLVGRGRGGSGVPVPVAAGVGERSGEADGEPCGMVVSSPVGDAAGVGLSKALAEGLAVGVGARADFLFMSSQPATIIMIVITIPRSVLEDIEIKNV